MRRPEAEAPASDAPFGLDDARARIAAPAGQDFARPPDAASALRLGWSLKQACYESWNTEPSRAEAAAACLRELAAQWPGASIEALAAWTAGIAALGQGAMETALVALDRAHDHFERAGEPGHAAQTQVPKLMALSVLGRHDEALRCAEATRLRFLDLGDDRLAGKLELNLGTLLFRQDRHAEAAARYRAAAARFAAVQDEEQSLTAAVGLANALSWLGELDEALAISQDAEQRARAADYPVLAAQALGSVGQLELLRDRPERALPALAEACRLFERAGGLPQRQVEAEITLADAYLAVQLLPEAAAVAGAALARCVSLNLPAERARAALQLGQARAALGEDADARSALQAARADFLDQGNPASAALAALQLARLDQRSADLDTAALGVAEARQQFEAAGIPSWTAEAALLAAEVAAARGRTAEARAGLQALLDDTALAAPWRVRVSLAELAAADGQPQAAAELLDEAFAAIEAQRLLLPGDDVRIAFGHDKDRLHELRVRLAWDAARPGGAPAQDRLLQALEAARARAFTAGLRPHTADNTGRQAEASAPDAARAAQRDRLAWHREQAAQALAGGDAAEAVRQEDAARALEQALLEAHRRAALRSAAAEAAADAGRAAAPLQGLAALQSRLAADEAWVVFHMQSAPQPRWLALVVRRDGAHGIEGSATGLAERLDGLRLQLEAQRHRSGRAQAHAALLAERTRRHLHALHQQVWAPLGPALAGCRSVAVLPHRLLHYVPWAALHDGEQHLVARHTLRLLPSLGGEEDRRAPEGLPPSVLAVGVGGPELPQVEAEARAVAALFGPGAKMLLGDAASCAAVAAGAAEAELLHLACHARFRADSPWFSALRLADGELSLHDTARLRLRARLVTLSACETGLSRIAPGDELLGLVRGFLHAGAQQVLASLWTVDDASTAALMQAFYRGLGRGLAPEQALAEVQAEAAAAGTHPFHWAAFALHSRS